ncbi:MAG: TPR end-of-group domain-containing protein [Anaerolineales bacterium]
MDTPENQAAVWNKIGDAYRALKDMDNAIQAYKKADALDMGTSPVEQKGDKESGDLPIFRELNQSEKKDPDSDILALDPEKTAPLIEQTIESQVIEDGFQPVIDRKDFVEEFPKSDPTDTKPIYLPNPRMDNDQINHPSTDNLNQKLPEQNKVADDLPRDKPLIVITEPTGIANTSSKDGSYHAEPPQTKSTVQISADGKGRNGKSKAHSNIGPGTDDLEEILAKVNIYENITRVNPTSDRGWDTLGKLYKALGRYKDAIGAYQKAIEVAPDKEVYYYYLGLLFSVEQQNEEAIQAFQFVLRKNPDYVLAHSALAGVYHRMGLENKANHHISIALPKMNNESTYNRACFYVICGDHELAFEFLQLALSNKETTIDWIKSDPDLDPIRSDQRYLELISEDDHPAPDRGNDNYFSSELEGRHNKLLPLLNHSLTR